MMGRLDAYRRGFGLHWNQFQTGEGATSKKVSIQSHAT